MSDRQMEQRAKAEVRMTELPYGKGKNGGDAKERRILAAAGIPERIAAQRPLIHMIPNSVTASLCADGLSAIGARPLMAVEPEEMEEIVSYADALVVNMGQPTREKLRAASAALGTAGAKQVPTVLDPVGAGASEFRRQSFSALLTGNWKGIIKGNRSETAALQSQLVSHQGIDSIGEFDLELRASDGRTWAVSGTTDVVFDETNGYCLPHGPGNRLMLTGSGCLTGAVMGACAAVEPDFVTAAIAAFSMMAYAAEQAALMRGYAAQKAALLDALTGIETHRFLVWLEQKLWRPLSPAAKETKVTVYGGPVNSNKRNAPAIEEIADGQRQKGEKAR